MWRFVNYYLLFNRVKQAIAKKEETMKTLREQHQVTNPVKHKLKGYIYFWWIMGPRKWLKEIIRWNVTKGQTSWLFIGIAEKLNSRLLRKIHLVDRAGLATQDSGLQAVQRGSDQAAILSLYKALAWWINKLVVSNSVGLLGSSVTGKKTLSVKQQRETDLKYTFFFFA